MYVYRHPVLREVAIVIMVRRELTGVQKTQQTTVVRGELEDFEGDGAGRPERGSQAKVSSGRTSSLYILGIHLYIVVL